MPGYVYAITNPSTNLVKIGLTQKDIADLRRNAEQMVSICIGCGCDDNRACFDEAAG